MNYPIWDVTIGTGLLMAIVSVVHVFVSHFAIGGGLFLVLTEKRAYRNNDLDLLIWLKRHTKFFVLVTVVFGALTGVGIWYTISLIHPSGTSSLIHSYLWGWAIEWVFFFLEITAAILYLYGWDKLSRKTHVWIGWIYFWTAFLSMVVINGIITYMLTAGKWIETHNFWHGFFNPTNLPSLFGRFIFALALAGCYALLTGSLEKDEAVKGRILRWSASWIVPAFVVLPLIMLWYIGSIPEPFWASARGRMPTATLYAQRIFVFAGIAVVSALIPLLRPRKTNIFVALVVFLAAFGTMWSFEYVREAIRKPYIITDFMYANSVLKDPWPNDGGQNMASLADTGILGVAKWVRQREITDENRLQAGEDIFMVQCRNCHSLDRYRGVAEPIAAYQWDETKLRVLLPYFHEMYNNVMPPVIAAEDELDALAAYLASEIPVDHGTEITEATLFQSQCGVCHVGDLRTGMFETLEGNDAETLTEMINESLADFSDLMPDYIGSGEEAQRLGRYIDAQINSTTIAGE